MVTGWNWFQNTGTDFYQIMLKPYVTTQLDLKYWLEIQRMMQQQLALTLNKFKIYVFYNFVFKQTGMVCFGLGWGAEPVQVRLSNLFDFVDCYKVMIGDLTDWNKTFLGRDARWIDECKPSGGASFVTIQDWLFTQSNIDQPLLGGSVTNVNEGKGCWQFAEWTKWTPYVAQTGYEMIKSVLGEPEHLNVAFSEYVDSLKPTSVEATI